MTTSVGLHPPRKRKIKILILSDLHLGSYGAHAAELLDYLESIQPEKVILNGDIIDIWQFKKKYFPAVHSAIINHFFAWIEEGIPVYYITGNHDDALRKFSPFKIDKVQLVDKLILHVDGKSYWIFHGDVFDMSIHHARWVAKLGGLGYDLLIRFNRLVNQSLKAIGKPPVSLSKKIKSNIKNAVKFISDFENTAIDLAIDQEYDYVVCGHIHCPVIKAHKTSKGKTIYMNSGDWVESLTSLEYVDKQWLIYHHRDAVIRTSGHHLQDNPCQLEPKNPSGKRVIQTSGQIANRLKALITKQ